jgi:hypothetical protein
MRTTRTMIASFCAVLGAAALAGPAAAGQQRADDSAKANVYVPPAALYTAAPTDHSVKANVYVPPAALSTASAPKADTSSPKAKPIDRQVPARTASPSDFDWGSAAIGAAVVAGACLIGLGGAAELRRRRHMRPATAG